MEREIIHECKWRVSDFLLFVFSGCILNQGYSEQQTNQMIHYLSFSWTFTFNDESTRPQWYINNWDVGFSIQLFAGTTDSYIK